MIVAVGCKQAPGFAARAVRKQQDGVPLRELECHVAALRLLRASHDKPIALVHPRAGVLVTDEKLAPSLVLQAVAILVRPVRRALPPPGVAPKVVASGHGSTRPIKAPGTLHVQGVGADGAVS